jgi:PAS domain S-box-containing protein
MTMATSPSTIPSLYTRELPLEAERDALARALELSEDRLRLLVSRTPAGVFRATPAWRLVEANPALVRMLGYTHELELYALAGDGDLFAEVVERERLGLQSAHGPVDCAAARWRRKDGTLLTVRISMRAVHDEGGVLAGYEGIVEDVSDRLRHQELLRRTVHMASVGTTLAGVAHELNNPLAAILGFAQLLLKKASDAESRVALETIDHEATRAGKIVRDLLTLARKRGGEAEQRVPVDLNDIVRYIVRTRSYALETHGIVCRSSLAVQLPPVLGNSTQLEQVVLNLLNNAEQAIRSVHESGGRVHVATRVEASAVVLEIEDDGPGIPERVREQIFDPFWTTRAGGDDNGAGLGLTIVRDIVVEHGGEIAVSRAAGELGGARFVIRFPHVAADARPAKRRRRAPARRALDVLIVEPDPRGASFLSAFLSSRGHAVLTAADIEYAVRLGNSMTFDAVICDAGIAGSLGALGAFRAAPGCAEARFIVAAGNAASTARIPLPLPPATSVLMRPYDVEELRLLLED